TASRTHSRRATRVRRRRRAASCSPPSSGLHAHAEHARSLDRAAVGATVHCLTGCAIGEVVGMAVTTVAGWGNAASIAVSVALAFVFGYALTLQPVLRAG